MFMCSFIKKYILVLIIHYSQHLPSIKSPSNTEFVNTELLLLGEILGQGSFCEQLVITF